MSRRTPDEIERIVTDAETLGEEQAAAKYKLSTRQIRRYRKAAETCPNMSKGVLAKRAKLSEGWLVEARKARMLALEKGLQLVEESKNLREVTGFLKIVHDAVLSDEMLSGSDGELDRPGHGVASAQAPGREVSGSFPTTTH